MSRICEHCYWEITKKYLLKQNSYERITCPNCGRSLKVTKISKLLYRYVEGLILLVILVLPTSLSVKLFIGGVWIVMSVLYIPAIIFNYEKLEKDKEY